MQTEKIVLTRKIEIYPNYSDKEQKKEAYKKLYSWRNICFKAANLISSHKYIQEQAKELIYFTEETKMKLADIQKDDKGMLNISQQSTTYRILSSTFKGEIPTNILASLNSQISSAFNKEKSKYFRGEISVRNYKKSIPIPFQSVSIRNLEKTDNKNYTFSLFGIDFKTSFGRDLSNNELIIDRCVSGEYKLCDSSIKIEDNKMFLLACIQFDKTFAEIDENRVCMVSLDINHPLIVNFGKKPIKIGDKEEFLYRRLAIQKGLRRAQIAATYNKGGHGIQKKIASIEKFKESETNYVNSRIHKYSKKLIDLCLKNKSGVIRLVNIPEVKEKTQENEFLLRNWSYFGLRDKIKYKASKFNIKVIEDEPSKLVEEESK